MPEIGRPQRGNSFNQVKMGPRSSNRKPQKQNSDKSVGAELNELAGNEMEDIKFVDRKDHNKLGKDGFLKLLTTQLANQDPIKPMDQKQFAADLAQFSQLEQLANLNSKFDKMGENQPTEGKFYGASFLGKEIVTQGTSIAYDGSARSVDLPYYLPKHAQKIMIRVFDEQNQMIAQLEDDATPRGQNIFTWDGKQLDGVRAVPGNYRFEIKAWDEQYQEFKGQTKTSGLVTGVNFENGETVLTIDNKKRVFLRDVSSFKLPNGKKQQVNVAAKNKLPQLKKNAASSYSNTQENTMN